MHKIYIDKHEIYPFFTISDDYTHNLFNSLLSTPYYGSKYPDFGCLDYDLDVEYNFRRALNQITTDFPEVEVVVIDYNGIREDIFLRLVEEYMALDQQAICA